MSTPYNATPGQTGYFQMPVQVATPSQTSPPTHFTSVLNSSSFDQSLPSTPTPAGRGRPRGSGTGAKRGRKPRGALVAGATSPRPFMTGTLAPSTPTSTSTPPSFANNTQYSKVHWAMPGASEEGAGEGRNTPGLAAQDEQEGQGAQTNESTPAPPVIDPALMGGTGTPQRGTPQPDISAGLTLPVGMQPPPPRAGATAAEEEGEGDDELLPAMADDDYSAQLSWNSQSKDNLKYAITVFTCFLN
jgi:transcription initiation factor TFIID subunit 11